MEKAGNEEIKSLSPGNGGHFTSRKLPQINTGDGDHGMMELNHDGINYSSIGEGVYWKIFHTGCMLTCKQIFYPNQVCIIDYSLGPVYEFVCISFRTDNLNCFGAS